MNAALPEIWSSLGKEVHELYLAVSLAILVR